MIPDTHAEGVIAMDKRLQYLLQDYPNYQNFTASDFSQLSDAALRSVIGAFAHKIDPQAIIPESFIRQYGDDAAGEMMLALEREATRRGEPEMYAEGALHGGLGGAAMLMLHRNDFKFDANVRVNVTMADSTVRATTAPRVLNFEVAQDALALMAQNEAARKQGTYTPQTSFNVVIPQEATAAVARANNLPQDVAEKIAHGTYGFPAGDELNYFAGYATRAGATKDISPVTMQYPPSAVCPAIKLKSQIANPNKPDVDAALAWAAGYIQSDVDQMSPEVRNAALASCPQPKTSVARR